MSTAGHRCGGKQYHLSSSVFGPVDFNDLGQQFLLKGIVCLLFPQVFFFARSVLSTPGSSGRTAKLRVSCTAFAQVRR